MSFHECQLGDVANFNYGKALPERARVSGEFPVFGSGGQVGTHRTSIVAGPGIVVGRKGTVGATYWVEKDFCPIDTTYFITAKQEETNLRYLYYLIKSLPLSEMNTDAAVPGLNRDNALRVKISFASPNEQKQIVSFLSAYDDLIENNRRRIALLEEAARLLYREWFVYFRFPGAEHVKIIDGVPEGWTKGTVQDLGHVITGKTPSTKILENFGSDVPFIKTPDMHASSNVLFPDEYLSEIGAYSQQNKTLPPRSILVACIGARLGVVSLNGKTCQTNQQINAVVPTEDYFRYYGYCALKGFREKLLAIGGGATMPNVNKTKFSSMELLIPKKEILENFHSLVEQSFEQSSMLIELNYRLIQARDLLLPRLMDGRLEI